jgi:hypothetical protein
MLGNRRLSALFIDGSSSLEAICDSPGETRE